MKKLPMFIILQEFSTIRIFAHNTQTSCMRGTPSSEKTTPFLRWIPQSLKEAALGTGLLKLAPRLFDQPLYRL